MDALHDAFLAATTIDERKRILIEFDQYIIAQHFTTWGPKVPQTQAVQPWVKGFNGENTLAPGGRHLTMVPLWIDQDLKAQMGY